MRGLAILLIVFAFLSFGNASQAQTDSHAYDNIHSIGIFSNLMPAVVTPKGPMPLDWDINADVTTLVSTALKDHFSVKAVSLDQSELQKSFSDGGVGRLGKFIQSIPPQDVDAYLVVVPDKIPDYTVTLFGGSLFASFSIPFFPGLSLRDGSDLFHPHSDIVAIAMYDLIMVNARTGETISWSRGRGNDSSPHSGAVLAFCKNDFLPRDAEEAGGAKGKAILDEMKIFVFTGLPHALKMMELPNQIDMAAIMPVQPSLCSLFMLR
ncbi:MAG TPA: hypothetical protein VFI23_00295 [Rhizomicrobium sp.]|nr:hypothetical protein [Rhizomicrobium sp.]